MICPSETLLRLHSCPGPHRVLTAVLAQVGLFCRLCWRYGLRPVARRAAWPAAAERASRPGPIAPAVFAAVPLVARTASCDEAAAAACMPAWARPSPSAAPPPATPDAMPGSCVLTNPANTKMTQKTSPAIVGSSELDP